MHDVAAAGERNRRQSRSATDLQQTGLRRQSELVSELQYSLVTLSVEPVLTIVEFFPIVCRSFEVIADRFPMAEQFLVGHHRRVNWCTLRTRISLVGLRAVIDVTSAES